MNKIVRIGLILLVILVVGIISAFLVPFFLDAPQGSSLPPRTVPGNVPGDFEFFYSIQAIISTVNIVLLIILLANYGVIFNKTRSQFTFGLIVFAAALLMKDLTSNPFVTALFGFHVFGLGIFVLLPDLFETAALIVLLYLALK